jgi:rhodanese-related sulfurtransferase
MHRHLLLAVVLATACRQASGGPPEQAPPASEPAAAGPSNAASGEALPDRDPELARRLVREEGAVLLDVRSSEEFAGGHVQGAVNIPHTEIGDRIDEIERLTGGDASKPIVVYCRSGRRSGIAKETLTGRGYRRVTNLGGIADWPDES